MLRKKEHSFDTEPARQFLASAIGFESLSAVASKLHDLLRFSPSELQEVQVPLIPADVAASLVQAERMESMIVEQGNKLRMVRERVLSSESEGHLYATLQDLNGQLLAAWLGVNQSSDLSHRIRNFYPLPLSYPYRVLQSEHEKNRILKQIYRTAEVQVAFLASVSLALGASPRGKLKDRVLSSWRGNGATFGGWLTVLMASISCIDESGFKLLRNMKYSIGMAEKPTRYLESIQWLNDQSNRFHHEDLADGPELDGLIKEAMNRLDRCFTELGFLM